MNVEGSQPSIVLCEPQCWGFEHAPFNAALLQTILLAYPETRVTFLGERQHLAWVQATLARASAESKQRVRWQEIDIPPRELGGWRRLRHEREWCKSVLEWMSEWQAQRLVLSSITAEGLAVLKLWMYRLRTGPSVLAIPHSLLSSVLECQPRRPWHWALSLRQVLRLPHPRGLQYIALGESIAQHLRENLPKVAVRFSSLDHPYSWTVPPDRNGIDSHPLRTMRFGHLGVVNKEKDFDAFVRLAAEVQNQASNVEFMMVGFLRSSDVPWRDCCAIKGVSHVPLSPEEYSRRASSLTYVIGTADPHHYRLVASASFLDALAYAKPGIYLRNPYVEYYFEQMGDIGYLCDSYEEMQTLVLSLVHNFPAEHYQQQRENILCGRERFTPRTLAPRLRRIL